MQATPILPHNAPTGQPQNHTAHNAGKTSEQRAQVINDWVAASEQAIEALFNWKAYLHAWQQHPASVPDDAFMSVVRDMAEAGLSEWLDASQADIDALRNVVTGGE